MAGAKPNLSKFIAGNLALDFVNSVQSWDRAQALGDHWSSYDDLLAWGEAAAALTARETRRLEAEAARTPREAPRVLSQATTLRDCLRRLFAAAAAGAPVDPTDLETLNTAYRGVLAHRQLVGAGEGIAWRWDGTPALDRMLWPVLLAAVDLATSERLSRVRECGGERCGWLFLDETKNRSRRWCEMSVCGNRAKARRHYDRLRHAGA